MKHPITSQTIRFTISKDFDYLTHGRVYRATPYRNGSGWRIDLDDESGGTFLRNWQMIQLLAGAAGYQEIGQ